MNCSHSGHSWAHDGWRGCCATRVPAINRNRVQKLMRQMGIASLGPCTTRRAPGHKVSPYLMRDLAIDRPARPVHDRHQIEKGRSGCR